jgi:hypothetical protein
MAAQNRSSFDQAEYSSMHTGGHKESAYAPSSSHLPTSSHPPTSNNNKWKRIPNVVNDSEFGCDENWIGPKNTSVNHLFVFDIPNMRDERDHRMLESKVHEYFERNAGISVDSVHTKIDKRDTLIARVK